MNTPETDTIFLGDCLDLLRALPDGCADLVLTDPPYGTTACRWDKPATGPEWWAEVGRVAKRNAAVLMFGQEPFASRMRLVAPSRSATTGCGARTWRAASSTPTGCRCGRTRR